MPNANAREARVNPRTHYFFEPPFFRVRIDPCQTHYTFGNTSGFAGGVPRFSYPKDQITAARIRKRRDISKKLLFCSISIGGKLFLVLNRPSLYDAASHQSFDVRLFNFVEFFGYHICMVPTLLVAF